jgi:ribosome-binding factor A
MSSRKAPSQRQLRVGELLRSALSDIFVRGEVNDPQHDLSLITVTEVSVAPDLRSAVAYILPLGGDVAQPIAEALNRSRRFIRGEVSRRVDLKYMPNIEYRLDKSFDKSQAIDRLLDDPRVARDLERKTGASSD